MIVLIGLYLVALWPVIARAFEIPEPIPIEPSNPQATALVAPVEALKAPEALKLPQERAYVPRSGNVLDRIEMCESGDNPTAKNPRSSASGLFQFLTSSWESYGKELWGSIEGKDIFSAKDNRELAEYVYEKYGTSSWDSSKTCWR